MPFAKIRERAFLKALIRTAASRRTFPVLLALPLFVLGILADHHDLAFPSYNLAFFANRFYRRPNLHRFSSSFFAYPSILMETVHKIN
jgi:hypothetical protein